MEDNTLLKQDINWLVEVIDFRVDQLLNDESKLSQPKPPTQLNEYNDAYAQIVKHYDLNFGERLILALSIVPYIASEYLDKLCLKNPVTGTVFTEFGGSFADNSSGFIPTGETAVYLIASDDLNVRLQIQSLLHPDNKLSQLNLVKLSGTRQGIPPMTGRLIPTDECLHQVLYHRSYKPGYSQQFPASPLETKLTWDDLVLAYDTYEALDEMDAWLGHHAQFEKMPEVAKKFKRGYRSLFYGPPGTGKTLTASLMGQKYGMDVYHIDLSMMVSKYIGETEKNLKNVFDMAENKNWILFFDEADALFGKRTQTQSSNDRYANQEVSYLLQRVEDYPGLIILASNLKANMDKAFLRRFQSIIYFPMPGVEERYLLWKNAFKELKLENAIDLRSLAKSYELSGAAIGNILRYCTLMALKRDSNEVFEQDILAAIKRELAKEGKVS